MSRRLGISVGASDARAVLMEGERLLWHAATTLSGNTDVAAAFARLLAELPPKPASAIRTHVALGEPFASVKRVDGLPPIKNDRDLSALVQQNVSAIFVHRALSARVPEIVRAGDGSIWAAVLDQSALDDIAGALRGRRTRLAGVAPTVSALAVAFPSASLAWSDGAAAYQLITKDGEAISLRRSRARPDEGSALSVPAALASIGATAKDFVTAYAAARLPARAAFGWRPGPSAREQAWARSIRATAAATLVIGTAVGAIGAPAIRDAAYIRAATRDTPGTRLAQIELSRVDGDLRRVTNALDDVTRFTADRGRMTLLLGEITRALPDSTAILSFRSDSIEGTIVALAPRVADVLTELASAGGIHSARVIGSASREAIGAVRLERATIRFARAGRGRRNDPPRAAGR